jgi:ribosomal protein L17
MRSRSWWARKIVMVLSSQPTRWDEIATEQITTATRREKELRGKVDDIVGKGGRMVSLSAGRIDAMKIIGHLANRGPETRLSLAFQRQLVDEGLAIHETDAGKLLFEQLNAELEDTN